MWTGVTKGFAGLKLSGSMKKKGAYIFVKMNAKKIKKALVASLKEKYG